MADNANNKTASIADASKRSSLQPVPAVGTGRQKTALQPGRSLMDWIRLSNSGEDMTGLHGQLRSVTPSELAKHNTREDCWMVIHDRVYDVTRYMEYHPGGVDELMQGAGIDATALFNEVHRWVNYSSMLSRCLVGPLVQPRANARRRKTIDHQALPSYKTGVHLLPPPRPLPSKKPSWDWTEDVSSMTLVMRYPDKLADSSFVSISALDSLLKLRVFVPPQPHVHNFHVSILSGLQWDGAMPEADGRECRILLRKRCAGDTLPTIGQVVRDEWRLLKEMSLDYLHCRLVRRTPVTHDSILLTIEWPEGMHMRIPIGHHVRVRAQVEGIEMARSYTPVCSSLAEPEEAEETQGRHLYLMLKVYSDGVLTPTLNALTPGDNVAVSPPEGSFIASADPFSSCQRLILVAAGTGFTPMARLLRSFLLERVTGTACLLFFNKTEADILWREQLDALKDRFPDRLQIVFILSAADSSWNGHRGRINDTLLREVLPEAEAENAPNANTFACVCGPDAFTDAAVFPASPLFYTGEHLHIT